MERLGLTDPAVDASGAPSRLFHYTTALGLLGIVQHSVLWATDARFLNDAEELEHAYELFADELPNIASPAEDPAHFLHEHRADFARIFDQYKDLVGRELSARKFPVYVACFCESPDLLSQWRAYGAEHAYAIEFDRELLEKAIQNIAGYDRGKRLSQIVYGRAAATSLLASAVRDIQADTNLGHLGVHAHYMALNLTATIAAIKHPGFSEEREWRAIVALEREEPAQVRFRASPHAILPYIEIPFGLEAIVGVRIGPGRHAELRRQGLQRLLRAVGSAAQVSASDVPLRT